MNVCLIKYVVSISLIIKIWPIFRVIRIKETKFLKFSWKSLIIDKFFIINTHKFSIRTCGS